MRRTLLTCLCLATLAGCADAPGVKKPLPIDYQEQSKAQAIYRRVGREMAKQDGVVSTYLTSTNNPRRIVCVVRDKATRTALKATFGSTADGLKIRYEIVDAGFKEDDGPIEEVQTQSLPSTLWDKFIFYMKNFAYRVLPSDTIDQPATPPPAAPADPNLKST